MTLYKEDVTTFLDKYARMSAAAPPDPDVIIEDNPDAEQPDESPGTPKHPQRRQPAQDKFLTYHTNIPPLIHNDVELTDIINQAQTREKENTLYIKSRQTPEDWYMPR